MANTVPNQKEITVHRSRVEGKQFLQITKENWYAANKNLGPYGLQLYLYFAGNCEGYNFAVSQVAAEQEAGIQKTTFHKYMKILEEKGYLIPKREGSNQYDFYEIPYNNMSAASPSEQKNPQDEQINLQRELLSSLSEQKSSPSNKEINNINIINKKTDSKYSKDFVF